MPAHSKLLEARRLSQLLLSASELSREIFAQIAGEVGVPVQVARALCLLEGPISMSELATKFTCDKSYITPLADQMEEKGLLERVPGTDRRTKLLNLTPHGISVQTKLETQIAKRSPVMVSLTPSERESLEQLLARLS
jgi:DNA-binding MarR family transcriptional regulator